MTITEIVQILSGFVGTVCFGFLFNVRRSRLAAVAIGGLLSCAGFLLLNRVIANEPIVYFTVAAAVSLYAEIAARVLKTPAVPIAITALIPLIPGGSLYHTMACAFEGDPQQFLDKALSTLALACALALGIVAATALSRLLFGRKRHVSR